LCRLCDQEFVDDVSGLYDAIEPFAFSVVVHYVSQNNIAFAHCFIPRETAFVIVPNLDHHADKVAISSTPILAASASMVSSGKSKGSVEVYSPPQTIPLIYIYFYDFVVFAVEIEDHVGDGFFTGPVASGCQEHLDLGQVGATFRDDTSCIVVRDSITSRRVTVEWTWVVG
jgi:hypothetical protein